MPLGVQFTKFSSPDDDKDNQALIQVQTLICDCILDLITNKADMSLQTHNEVCSLLIVVYTMTHDPGTITYRHGCTCLDRACRWPREQWNQQAHIHMTNRQRPLSRSLLTHRGTRTPRRQLLTGIESNIARLILMPRATPKPPCPGALETGSPEVRTIKRGSEVVCGLGRRNLYMHFGDGMHHCGKSQQFDLGQFVFLAGLACGHWRHLSEGNS